MPDVDTQTSDATPDSERGKNWVLVAEGDWLAGQRFIIQHHALLGRDPGCDITIPGTHLSRRHAELAVSGQYLLISDLNSSNGTFVNGEPVSKGKLCHGDRVRFDVLEFRVVAPIPAAPVDALSTNKSTTPSEKKAGGYRAKQNSQRKTRPSGVGNRHKTIAMTAVQKATRSIELLLWAAIGLVAIGGVVYLITHL